VSTGPGRSFVSSSADSVCRFGSGNGFLPSGTNPRGHRKPAPYGQTARPSLPGSLGPASPVLRRSSAGLLPFTGFVLPRTEEFPVFGACSHPAPLAFPSAARPSAALPGDVSHFLLSAPAALASPRCFGEGRAAPLPARSTSSVRPAAGAGLFVLPGGDAGLLDHPGLLQRSELPELDALETKVGHVRRCAADALMHGGSGEAGRGWRGWLARGLHGAGSGEPLSACPGCAVTGITGRPRHEPASPLPSAELRPFAARRALRRCGRWQEVLGGGNHARPRPHHVFPQMCSAANEIM